MTKHFGRFVFVIALLSLYIWPSCQKKDNDPPPTPGNDTIVTPKPNDTTPRAWFVSTLAGSTASGWVDGPANYARFKAPDAIVQDAKGDLYVGESYHRCIRKITKDGQVTTFVKEDSATGYLVGEIFYLTTDGNGNFYFPYNQYQVRKLTSSSSAIFAGSDVSDYKDGPDTTARFRGIRSIYRDPKGNHYISDFNKQNQFVIRKITTAGLVSTLSLNDNTGYANSPVNSSFYSIAIDSAGNVFFSASIHHLIKKIDLQGNVTVFAGTSAAGFKDGKGQEAQFNGIIAMEIDNAGNVLVCDMLNHAIRKITPDGTVTTIAGKGQAGFANGKGPETRFNYPWALTIDKSGVVYVVEGLNHMVRKIEYK